MLKISTIIIFFIYLATVALQVYVIKTRRTHGRLRTTVLLLLLALYLATIASVLGF